ncbi:MAG TPA: corrinoid protein [Thermodesulfobacteriota bacterium]|nr:corrinoid protein [Thermodesulfobacteriota bacterium]
MEKTAVLEELARAVLEMDADLAVKTAGSVVSMGLDPYSAIVDGLGKGMDKANELFEKEEYFVPELLLCADAMYAGIEILRPHLPKESARNKKKAVIGVVKGDTHDIGKNLVKIMLDNAGIEMHDLGRDVPYAKFVDTAGEINADLVCLSTLMTTTMDGMQVIIEDLKKCGITSKVLVGGGPISPGFASSIGADGYAKNAAEAVKVAKAALQGVPFSSLVFNLDRPLVGIKKSTATEGGAR